MNSLTLYYVYDPMCSWCWGFNKTWNKVKKSLPKNINIQYVLGGLAPDSNEIMSDKMREYIQYNWQKIEKNIPGTIFNYDFWTNCTPVRSTYPACRAVIAAKNQNDQLEISMINAIQEAYYLYAKNPSKDTTLINIAKAIGLNVTQFKKDLNSKTTQQQLDNNINLSKSLGAKGFPSIILEKDSVAKLIKIDYNNSDFILKQILT